MGGPLLDSILDNLRNMKHRNCGMYISPEHVQVDFQVLIKTTDVVVYINIMKSNFYLNFIFLSVTFKQQRQIKMYKEGSRELLVN